jgi:pathogenesis-related protein 1
MRPLLWLLIVFAGTGGIAGAQWRKFDRIQLVSALSPLSRDLLAAHNAVRARLGVASLVWSDRLAVLAQDWADKLLAHNQFAHRPNNRYGENLFEITGATASPEEVVNTWAAETRNYEYKSNTCHGECLHYTQIVWRDTREVGCGVARRGVREVWVCDYEPPGNVVGERPY